MAAQERPLVGYEPKLLNGVEVAEGTMALHRRPLDAPQAHGAAGKRDSLPSLRAGEPASQDGCPSGAPLTRRPVRQQPVETVRGTEVELWMRSR
jgi:hypothetical protein